MTICWLNPRIRPALLSLLLASCALVAALRVVPLAANRAAATHALQGSTGLASGEGPVFRLDQDLFPHQCGRGRLTSDGVLRLYPYDNEDCQTSVAWLQPLLLAADPRVPWALVPATERDDLQQLSQASLEHLHEMLLRLLHAPFFTDEYMPLIQDLLSTAVQHAAASPGVNQVLNRAAETVERDSIEALFRVFITVLAEKVRADWWHTLSNAVPVLFDSANPKRQAAMTQLLSDVLADSRVRARLSHTLPELLASPQALAVGTALAAETSKALLRDERLPELAGRLISDQRLLGLRPFGADAERLLAALPKAMLRMRHHWDHNPLVTYVLRSQLRGERTFLVLLLNAEQEQKLAAANLPPAPRLKRMIP